MDWVKIQFNFNISPISMSIFILWSEIPEVEEFISTIKTRNRRFVLYIVDDRQPFSPDTNCVYHDYWVSVLCLFHLEQHSLP